MNKIKVLGLVDGSGCKYHRIKLPLALMSEDDQFEIKIASLFSAADLKDLDILFINRVLHSISINDLLHYREAFGFKIVVDYDDFWRLGADHVLFDSYKHYQASEIMEIFLEIADAVFVTHDRLYYEAANYSQNVFILPNALPDVAQFQYKKTPDPLGKIRLFWAGGVTHLRDLELIRNPFRRISSDPRVKFIIGGYIERESEWEKMISIFTNGGRSDSEVLKSLPVENYFASYSRCDVSIVPLIATTFNGHKSNLKILEAAKIGAPVVVSKVNPYLNFPDHLVNYVSSQSEWRVQINRLINNPNLITDQGAELQKYCNEHFNFLSINETRKQIFSDLKNK